jgi:O-antigen ligase
LVLLIGLALSLLTFQTSGRLGKIVSLVVILGVGATIARSGSRGGFVGLVVVGLSLLFMMNTVPMAKRLLTVGAIGIALSLAAPAGYWQQMETILEPTEDYNWTDVDGRKEVAKRGVSYMSRFPVFGLGINNFARAECFLEEKGTAHVPGTGRRCTPPHNTWLQAGAELGVPGLAMWLVLTLGSVIGMNRLRRKLPKGWKRGTPEERFLYLSTIYIAVAMISFMATSTFLSFAWADIVYVLAALIGGVYHSVSVKLYEDRFVNGGVPAVPSPRGRRRRDFVTARIAVGP